MFQAINSHRGKAIEALFIHALRVCRIVGKAAGTHKDAWERVRPVFDREISKCKNSNFEFSTMAGRFLAHIEFLDKEWLREHVKEIFPDEFRNNAACAFDGQACGGGIGFRLRSSG
jgi:hypothetical protein